MRSCGRPRPHFVATFSDEARSVQVRAAWDVPLARFAAVFSDEDLRSPWPPAFGSLDRAAHGPAL